MFENILKGFSFIKQSFVLITKDGDATMSEAWAATKKNAVTLFYLSIISAIVIEDRDLKGAVARASDIMQKHLLPIGVGEIAVGFVTGLLTIIGFIVAIVIGYLIFGAMSGANAIAGALIAIVVAAVIIVLVIALSMYVTTAYHTCLFLWAKSVEDAGTGAPGTVKPLAPIANALGV